MDTNMKSDEELANDGHDLGYTHTEGICDNESCRKSICKDEWEYCEECKGKGYHKLWTK